MYNPPEIVRNDKMPTALVAGGAGFLGRALCESLLAKNLRVIAVDNLETGRKENVEPFFSHPRFVFFEHDLNKGLPEKIKSVDFIFHLAAHATYLYSTDESITLDSLLTNALTTNHLLEFAKECQARFLFASTVDIYQGVVSATDLIHYFGPTPSEEKMFSHTEAKRFAESLVWEYFKKFGLDVRIARLGKVYGPGVPLAASGSLGHFIEDTINGQNLVIEGDGLEKNYYCFLSDALSGIEAALFNKNTKGKIYPLTDLQPVTTLEEAYIVKKFAPAQTEVIFKPRAHKVILPEIRVIDGQDQRDLGWAARVSLKSGVSQTLSSMGFTIPEGLKAASMTTPLPGAKSAPRIRPSYHRPKVSLPHWPKFNRKPTAEKTAAGKNKLQPLFIAGSAFLLLLFILRPVISLAYYGSLSYQSLTRLEQKVFQMDLETARKEAARSATYLESAKSALTEIPYLPYSTELQSLMATALYTTKGMAALLPALVPYKEELYRLGFTETAESETGTAVTFEKTAGNLTEGGENLSLALAEIRNVRLEKLPEVLQQKARTLATMVEGLAQAGEFLKIFSTQAGTLLGYEGKKNYLVLFENSQELRPNGGFIGSYARLTLDNGYLKDLKIDDIYNPDGLLDEKKIIYPVPAPIKENLGTDNLRIRDANWDADFTVSGKTIIDLYTKATNEPVSGLIALDLNTISRLLKVIGPVNLPSFGETITSENLFERTEFHSEAAFFPGSTAKKTFLSLLGQQMLYEFFNLKTGKFPEILNALSQSLTEKDLLIYLPESKLSGYLGSQGWDGSVKSPKSDFLMLVEANVGSTKANYFVRRQLKYKVEKINREGELEVTLALNYTHTGKDNTWPGGPLKNYLRLLVPSQSALLKVERSSESLEGKGEDITNAVKIGQESGKTVFATLFTLKAGENLSLTFRYVVPPEILNLASAKSYRLLIQKQPGAENSPFVFDFTPPFGKSVTTLPIGDNFQKIGELVRWQCVFDRDLQFTLDFN